MTYKDFKNIMDNNLKVSNIEFIKGILKDFDRFSTNFQLLPFKEKLKQYYFTKINIKYGYALEEIVKRLIVENNGILLNGKISNEYNCDLLFELNDKIYLIEQKVRDDHDSSKKKGQVENYLVKVNYLKNKYGENIKTAFWFIDGNFKKNKGYYEEIIPNDIFYGNEIDHFLNEIIYNELYTFCKKYKEENQLTIPDFSFNYQDYTVSEIYNLFSSSFTNEQISEYFFLNGDIPYKDIYSFFLKKRKTEKRDNLLFLLKERGGLKDDK